MDGCINILEDMDILRFVFFPLFLDRQVVDLLLGKDLALFDFTLAIWNFALWAITSFPLSFLLLLFVLIFLLFQPPIKISTLNLDSNRWTLIKCFFNMINFNFLGEEILLNSLYWWEHLYDLRNAIGKKSNWILKDREDHNCCKRYLGINLIA